MRSGLRAGEEVVLEGQNQLSPGGKVSVRPREGVGGRRVDGGLQDGGAGP